MANNTQKIGSTRRCRLTYHERFEGCDGPKTHLNPHETTNFRREGIRVDVLCRHAAVECESRRWQVALFSLEGTPVDGFDVNPVTDIVKGAVPNPDELDIEIIDQYDLYYLDRTRERPLPVLRVLMNDAEQTRYTSIQSLRASSPLTAIEIG